MEKPTPWAFRPHRRDLLSTRGNFLIFLDPIPPSDGGGVGKGALVGKGADLTPPKFLRLLPLIAQARGDVHPLARWEQSQDRIVQRPAMARSARLAESMHIYNAFK